MAKTIARTHRLEVESIARPRRNVTINIKITNVPKMLMAQARNALLPFFNNTLPNPIPYPLPIDLPEGTDDATIIKVRDLLIQYFLMREYVAIIEGIDGEPQCDNGQCMVAGVLDCCPKPPDTLMAVAEGEKSLIITKNAYMVTSDMSVRFLDSTNASLYAVPASPTNRNDLRYYRLLDDELLDHIEVKIAENYQYTVGGSL
jgi:hypothetical protein